MKHSKLYKEQLKLVGNGKEYNFSEALDTIKQMPAVKFDQTLELSLKLGIDPKQGDQNVRGVVALPHGTGKTVRVAVIGPEDLTKGINADFIGNDDLVEKIKSGWTDFDILISTPDFMPKLRTLGKILGPKGLMPNPKTGTVSKDLASATKLAKAGRVEYRSNKLAGMNVPVGKLSFPKESLEENIQVLVDAINKARPNKCKGTYILSSFLSATMTPSLKIDMKEINQQ